MNHTLEDVSLEKINLFIEKTNDVRIHPINDDPLTVLKKIELLKQNQITNGCFLLFATKNFLSGIIEAGRFSSDTVIKDSLSINNDLIAQVDLLIDFIKKHISRGYHFTGKAQREERWEYPMDAIREIVTNMIVHRDYKHPGDSIVKIYDNSIEFFNPGKLVKGLTLNQLKKGNYISSVRNKQIAMIFKEAGLIEKYGSGIRRVIKTFKECNLPEPLFEESQHGFKVTVFTTQKTTQKTTKEKILYMLNEQPNLSRISLAKTLGKSESTIKEHLSNLKTEGKLKRIGSDRSGYWEVVKNE